VKLMMALLCFYCANRCRMFRESYWFSVKFVFDLGGRMHNGSGEQASHVTGGHHVAAAAPAYNHLIPAAPTSATRTRPPLSTAVRTWRPHTLRSCVGQRVPVAVSRSTAVLHPRIAR
jgi:hypothetical protein